MTTQPFIRQGFLVLSSDSGLRFNGVRIKLLFFTRELLSGSSLLYQLKNSASVES